MRKFVVAFLLALVAYQGVQAQTPIRATAQIVKAQTGTSYAIINSDAGKLLTFSNASAIAVSIPQAGAGSLFKSGWFVEVKNLGVGTVTITPAVSTIGGNSTLVLTTSQSAKINSNGTNYLIGDTSGDNAGIFNVKSYGAVCDGSTNDTVAINAAITAASVAGGTVFIPATASGCLVTGTGTQIFLMQKPIKLAGDGPNSQIVVSTGSSATYIFRYNPLTFANQGGFEMRDFTIRSWNSVETNYSGFGSNGNFGCGAGGAAGLDTCAPGTALALDTTSAASTITPSHITIRGMQFLPLLGRAIVTVHVSPNTAGVPARTTIGPRNLIYNGIQINNGGDTVTIRENEIIGRNGLEVELISGATTVAIVNNNITADGGIWIKGGSVTNQYYIGYNIVEVYKSFGSTSGHNGAIIDVDGASGAPAFLTIEKNQISSLVDIVLNGIRVNTADFTKISDNSFRTPATTFAIVNLSNALNTVFGRNLQEGAGGLISDADNSSIQEILYVNSAAVGTTEFAKLITSTNQVFNTAGTQQSRYKAVVGAVSLSGGTATVTFTGSAIFTSNTTFQCFGANATNANAFKILKDSGSQLTITGTGSDAIMFRCEGN